MIRKTISLPEPMADFIEARIKSGLFGNDSEYFRELVRQDQQRQSAVEELQAMIDAAKKSGVSAKAATQIWEEAKKRAKRG